MSRVIRRMLVVAAAGLVTFGGVSLSSPSNAYADPPKHQKCGAAHAKGGPKACDPKPMGTRERECYRAGAIGVIPGLVTGNPLGAGAGGVAGCISGATAPGADDD